MGSIPANHQSGHKAIEKSLKLGHFIKCNVVQKIDHSPVGCGWSCFNLTIYEGNTVLLETYYRFQCKDEKNENGCRL